MTTIISRRNFIKKATCSAVAAALSPTMLVNAAQACSPKGKHVVCVYFDGGFDWLGWVFPNSPTAEAIRPSIQNGIKNNLLSLNGNNQWLLHPNLVNFRSLYNQGKVAIIPQTHYLNASGSHAESREQYLRGLGVRGGGMEYKGAFIRIAEANNFGSRRCVFSVSGTDRMTEPPARALNMDNLNGFGFGGQAGLENGGRMRMAFQALGAAPGQNAMQDELKGSWKALEEDATAIQGAVSVNRPDYAYNSGLASNFEEVEAMIRAFPSQATLSFVRFGGHDTHGNEVASNIALASNFDASLGAFLTSLASRPGFPDISNNVSVLVMSEFGRTNRENGGAGTDHARATAMFLIGNGVNGGVFGDIPTAAELLDASNGLPMEHNLVDVQYEIYERYLGLPNVGAAFPGHTYSRIGIVA